MAADKAMIPFLVSMMLLTGVCNTILTKYQDNQCMHNCDDPDPHKRRNFEQPVWQTAQMFVGEAGCWLVIGLATLFQSISERRQQRKRGSPYQRLPAEDDDHDTTAIANANGHTHANYGTAQPPTDVSAADHADVPFHTESAHLRPLRGWRVILLALPACADLTATTLMNIGLLFVAASIYQMTRGALVLFVGVFSVLFLKRRLSLAKWTALIFVVGGVAIVGLAGYLEHGKTPHIPPVSGHPGGHHGKQNASTDDLFFHTSSKRLFTALASSDNAPMSDALRAVLGVCLIALAQIFTATQFVAEEAIMARYALKPLNVVGWEGIFGLVATALGMVMLHFAVGQTPAGKGGYFDLVVGWEEISSNPAVAISSVLIMISIGGFNYFGLSVTRSVSATSRSTIDTCRTLFIWIVSLGLGWETFKWLQVVGFAALVYGTFLFNELVKPPQCFRSRARSGE